MTKKTIPIEVKDTVGVTFRTEKGARTPKESARVLLSIGRSKITLIVRHVQKRKDGRSTVWAFVCEGEGDGVRLAKNRGKTGTLSY